MSSAVIRIGVMPMGEVPDIASKVIAAHILGYFNLRADILPPLEHPIYAYDEIRLQYNVVAILNTLDSMSFHDYEKVIAVLNVDIFVPVFTHVFGGARQGGRYALVSLFRLGENLERVAKVALHELGHLFNLHHCMDRRCLMHFSGGLEDLDNTPLYFRRYCSAYLREAFFR